MAQFLAAGSLTVVAVRCCLRPSATSSCSVCTQRLCCSQADLEKAISKIPGWEPAKNRERGTPSSLSSLPFARCVHLRVTLALTLQPNCSHRAPTYCAPPYVCVLHAADPGSLFFLSSCRHAADCGPQPRPRRAADARIHLPGAVSVLLSTFCPSVCCELWSPPPLASSVRAACFCLRLLTCAFRFASSVR